MRIEINTKEATAEELLHLSDMLLSLSGKQRESGTQTVTEPSSAFTSMFGDPSPQTSAYTAPQESSYPSDQSQSSTPSNELPSGDLFSLFSDNATSAPTPSSTPNAHSDEPKDPQDSIRIIEY